MEFEWNLDKAAINLKKHNVSFQEATTVFGDALSVTFPDPEHSVGKTATLLLECLGQGSYWLSHT